MNSLKKTQESWNAYTPVSKELLKQTEDVLDAFLHEKREEIEMQTNKFHKTFHAEKSEDENIYLCYLKQSVRYLEILLDDTSLEEDDAGVPSENGELEVDEYDTSYCASLMWKYQDMEADEITRKRRQAEFWVWYIKEAARLCDDPIKERIKVESFIPDPPCQQSKTHKILCGQSAPNWIISNMRKWMKKKSWLFMFVNTKMEKSVQNVVCFQIILE